MKDKINKEVPIPDLKRISVLIVYSVIIFGATSVAWYYFAITIPAQEVEARNRHLETMLEMYKTKYCELPYRDDAVKRFCTSKTFPSNDK